MCSCANYSGAPAGGPKDKMPPVLLRAIPANHSPNFKGNQIKLDFDEFIVLMNQANIVSSPPLNSISYVASLKSLQIRIKDTLRSNTTYSLFFSNSIVDLNENTPLENFSYVFSTGSVVDSGLIRGKVIDAFTLAPRENVLVGAYEKWESQFPFQNRPAYIAKTNKEGLFSLENLPQGCYQLAAIADANLNFKLDVVTEDFAFLEDCVQVNAQGDTSFSLLSMYREELSFSNVEEFSFISRGVIRLKFREPIYDFSAALYANGEKVETPLYYTWAKDAKSVEIKFTPFDQAKVQLIEQANRVLDTLDLVYVKSSAPEFLPLKITTSALPVNLAVDSVYLLFSNPINSAPLKKIQCINTTTKDTVFDVKLVADGFDKLRLDFEWQPECDYQIVVLDSTFKDIYGQMNKDTLLFKWKNNAMENYGALSFTLEGLDSNCVYWMFRCNEKGDILEKTKVENAKVYYPYLPAEPFIFKLLEDKSGNGYYTPGDFASKRQPERIFIYPKSVKVEVDWRTAEYWDLLNH